MFNSYHFSHPEWYTVEQFEGTQPCKRTKLGVTGTCLCCWTKQSLSNIFLL